MAATEAQIAAFVGASGRNWKNICQALVYQICNRFGVANRVYSSATAARQASTIRSTSIRHAPMGAIHYWDYWATIGGKYANYGHVGVDTRGGGVGIMSTGRGYQIGNGAAIIDFQSWTNDMGKAVKYLGWSLSNGQNAVTIVPTGSGAGGGETPLPEKPKEWDEMASKQEIKDALAEVVDARANIAADYKILKWGTGLVAFNPRNGRVWVLPSGYAELLRHVGYAAGPVPEIDDAQLEFLQGFFPAALGDRDVSTGQIKSLLSEAAKEAIEKDVPLISETQFNTLRDELVKAVLEGGADSIEQALAKVTFTVKATS